MDTNEGRINKILQLAEDSKIRLLIEQDPDNAYRVWCDVGEVMLIKKWFRGSEHIVVPTPFFMQYPVIPKIQALPYSIHTETRPFIVPYDEEKVWNVFFYNCTAGRLVHTVIANNIKQFHALPLHDQISAIVNATKNRYTVNIARSKVLLFYQNQ